MNNELDHKTKIAEGHLTKGDNRYHIHPCKQTITTTTKNVVIVNIYLFIYIANI